MKNLIHFSKRILEILFVLCITYTFPAIGAALVFLDKDLYLTIVKSPAYAAVMFFISMGSLVFYVDYVVNKGKQV